MSPQQYNFWYLEYSEPSETEGDWKCICYFHWCDCSLDHGHILWKHCLMQGLLFISDWTECSAFWDAIFHIVSSTEYCSLGNCSLCIQKNVIKCSLYILYTAALERVVWCAIQSPPLAWSLQTFNVVVHSQEWTAYERVNKCVQAMNIYQTIHMQIHWTWTSVHQ